MSKFITHVAMEVTKEQYKNDLEGPLKKLGYKWRYGAYNNDNSNGLCGAYPLLFTQYDSTNNALGSNNIDYILNPIFHDKNYYLINHYNPELFLALAAMSDEEFGIKGEWVICIKNSRSFTKGMLYQIGGKFYKNSISPWSIIKDDRGEENGLLNEYFRKATKEELIEYFSKNGFVLPEKWCIKRDGDTLENRIITGWINKTYNVNYSDKCDNDYYYYDGNHGDKKYTEITFEQFKKYVLKKSKNMKKETYTEEQASRFPFKLSPSDAARIINIACITWKQKLAAQWGKNMVLDDHIIITESRYKEMRNACDGPQNVLFDDIFGKDVEEFKLGNKVKIISGGNEAFCANGKIGYIVPNANFNHNRNHGNLISDMSNDLFTIFEPNTKQFYSLCKGFKLELIEN